MLGACLELRFHEADGVSPGVDEPGEARQHLAQGDERDVRSQKVCFCAEELGGGQADVEAFEARDALVCRKAFVQLVVTHVDGPHVRRACLKHAVGKTARGGTGVNAVQATQIDAPYLERTRQLQPTAPHEGNGATAHLELVGGRHHGARLGADLAVHVDEALCDGCLGLFARRAFAEFGKHEVEPCGGGHFVSFDEVLARMCHATMRTMMKMMAKRAALTSATSST